MHNIIQIAQIVISVLLIMSILLQNRGTGLGGAFGGEANVYRSKRGIEKVLFNATIVLGVLFIVLSILSLFYFSK